jgi:hypothetical protein
VAQAQIREAQTLEDPRERRRALNMLRSTRTRERRAARRQEIRAEGERLCETVHGLCERLRSVLDLYGQLAAAGRTVVGHLMVAIIDPQAMLEARVEECIARMEDVLVESGAEALLDDAERFVADTGRQLVDSERCLHDRGDDGDG